MSKSKMACRRVITRFFVFFFSALLWRDHSVSEALQQADGSLISFDEALIGPTVCFSCGFDALDVSRGERRGRTGGGEGVRRRGGDPWRGQKFGAGNLSPAWFGTQNLFGVSLAPHTGPHPRFCRPPPPSNWI